MTEPLNLHASLVILGEAGVLLRGPAGAGKSATALALIAAARRRGLFGALVADDRVLLVARHDRLVGRPHPAIAGAIEVRGAGILAIRHEPAALVRLVVDLVREAPRLPAADTVTLLEVTAPLATCAPSSPVEEIVFARLRTGRPLLGATVAGPREMGQKAGPDDLAISSKPHDMTLLPEWAQTTGFGTSS